MCDLASDRRQVAPRFPTPFNLSLIITPRLLQCRLSLGAFLTAQYHATPLSHSRQRLRVCFWLAPLLS